jgi:hypothetical protein
MVPAVQELSQLESKTQLLYLKRHFGKFTHNRSWTVGRFVELEMICCEILEGSVVGIVIHLLLRCSVWQKVCEELWSYSDEIVANYKLSVINLSNRKVMCFVFLFCPN